ncbi:hypothetical protein I314_05502 [Cryptococcus bacillisporus CA1873]|uniref:Zinc finger C2HC5-type domain-containing protein n=1 Tax=Cryptococcus bacillisporus CA1873 TaxID=1296111 RepID=A0ABR5B504_CRYGA|nr:hypothetical protein I314_05502 [Cryptococcus bacillisporus CA1873]|eukprot:KIR58663.1 hypothetical protein I314_05502 [Cryptococcus gattii CA1873]
MPLQRPPWVVKDIADILGLDDESVKQMIVPDLESQNIESRLRTHLQDFLGLSQAAKDFTSRYLALRFPSLTNTPSSVPSTQLTPNADLLKSKAKAKTPTLVSAPTAGSSSGINTKEFEAAFGPGGKIYMKNRDADDISLQIGRSSQAGASRSGSNTPIPRQRQGGAISVNIVEKPKAAAGVATGKGKGKVEKIWDVPKSKEVKKIEAIIASLRSIQESGPKSGEGYNCFCQARLHTLSPYTPICQTCGLIICTLHAPHLPCPSCAHPLYNAAQLSRLILKVETDLENQLEKERMEELGRERERQEMLLAESGGGQFPSLTAGSASATGTNNVPLGGARKVISIGAKDKEKGRAMVTATTYRNWSSTSSRRPKTPPPENIMPRPRSIPVDQNKAEKELTKVLNWRKEEGRPWGNMKAEKRGDAMKYVGVDVIAMRHVDENTIGRRRKGKLKTGEAGRIVPGAQTKA